MSNFTEMDCYLFGQATHYDIYRKMGAHVMTMNGVKAFALMCGLHMRSRFMCLESSITGMKLPTK